MMRKCNTNKGFTLVELLGVILVIGILLGISIAAVMSFIDKARTEQVKSQEKTLTMAAKNYLQENRGLLPKAIGETTTISVKVLKSNKYLTEDIKNSKKQSCMENSYVTAHKESKTKYIYKAYLYCGGETGTSTIAASTPTIKIDFVDSTGKSIENDPSILENVSEAKFIIDFTGGERDGKKIGIDGYSYSILVKLNGENALREVYSSGTLSANHATYVRVDRDNNLKDYIDISDQTTVAIKAIVRNLDGGVNDKVEFVGNDTEQAEVVYHDKKAPICVENQTIGESAENDWINTNTPTRERKITVVCKDGSGSGCVRSTFTKTWSGDKAFEYDNIQIKDNAGNTTNCKVRVNVDKLYPVINLDAFAMGNDEGTSVGSSILTGIKTTENSSNGTAVINSNEYENLFNGYMNLANYPNGVIYRINLSETVALKSWKWEVNKTGIKSTSDSNYEVVNSDGVEAKVSSGSDSCIDKKNCSINVELYESGLRKGVLTVYDKAGNKSVYTIYANINRYAPTKPTIINSSTGNSTGAWSNSNVTLTIRSTDNEYAIADYYYTFNSSATAFGVNPTNDWVRLDGGSGKEEFDASWSSEMNKKIYIKACNVAGNCSVSSNTKIMIDKTAPTGLQLTGYKKNSEANITSAADAVGLDTINSNTWYKGRILVLPSGAIDSGSDDIYYKVTVTGASENVVDSVQDYRNVNAEGISTVSFKACDAVDNCSGTVSFIAKLDRTGPTRPTITNPSGGNWTKSNITLTIGSNDTYSGIKDYYQSYSSSATEKGSDINTQWVKIDGGTGNASFSPGTFSNDINKTIYIKACDVVGNCSSTNSTIVRIDKTPPIKPTITNPTGGNWSKSNFKLTLESTDGNGSGLADYQYTYNEEASTIGDDADTQWKSNGQVATETYLTTDFSIEREQYVYWRVCDAIGNCSATNKTMIKLDKTPPTCGDITATGSPSGVSGTISCSDTGSGCEENSYSFGPLTASSSVVIKDVAKNQKNCPISVIQRDCSTYDAWSYISVYPQSNNSCPGDTSSWDYEFSNCSTGDFADLCGTPCGKKCPVLSNCRYVCCIKRRAYPKTCYEH